MDSSGFAYYPPLMASFHVYSEVYETNLKLEECETALGMIGLGMEPTALMNRYPDYEAVVDKDYPFFLPYTSVSYRANTTQGLFISLQFHSLPCLSCSNPEMKLSI